MNKIVTLIGYRATGKSTVGPTLAKRLGWTCIDSDVELEQKTNRSIAQIFADDGESEFRRLERDTIVELLQRDQLVLSAGGGAILNEATRKDMRAAGPVVWLQASVDTIVERLNADPKTASSRPNLTAHTDQQSEVTEVLKARAALYADASTIVIDTDQLDSAAVTDAIYNQIRDTLIPGDGR